MSQRISTTGAVLLAMALFALPARGAEGLLEPTSFGSGVPKVFAVGEFKGWLSRPQLQAGGGPAGVGATLVPQGRRSAGSYQDRRWSRPGNDSAPQSYMLLKGGVLHVTEDPATTGGLLGIEMGGTMENVVQLGFSLDYFYHSTREMDVLNTSEANGLPVTIEQTLTETVAHLVPVGLTMRIRIPIASSAITPFISGTLSYEMLFLESRGVERSTDPVLSLLEEKETFTGVGWQAAAGLDIGLSPMFGLIGEVGWHQSSPSKEIIYNGEAVDLKINLEGPFLRGGLRIFM